MRKEENKEVIYTAKVNNVEVSGKSYKEFTINYLTVLVNQHKDKAKEKRLQAYLDYFTTHFNYDKQQRENILKKEFKETRETNERFLFELLHDNKGVCQQLTQAFALLARIDRNITHEDYMCVSYANCEILVKGKRMGHAINLCSIDGKALIVDISSMIHARDKDYKQPKENFALIPIETYLENLKFEGVEIVPIDPNDELYLACIKMFSDVDILYTLLNYTPDDYAENEELNKAAVYRFAVPTTTINEV